MVTGIANLTNLTLGSGNDAKLEEKRLTLARSLSQVSNLIRGDPEIISNKEKDELKQVINTLIGIKDENTDVRELSSTEVFINQTLKVDKILTS